MPRLPQEIVDKNSLKLKEEVTKKSNLDVELLAELLRLLCTRASAVEQVIDNLKEKENKPL